jgi:tetratricopeptide (TPR) repeat protein
MALAVLGRVQFRLGRYDKARAWWRRGLAFAHKTGLHDHAATCLVGLGDIELALGNPTAAQRLYAQCLSPARQPQPAVSPGALPVLIGLGRVALFEGRLADAQECFRQVLSTPRRRTSATAEALVYTAEALLRQGELARPTKLCGFLLSWPGTPHHVKETARKLIEELEARLPPEELAAATERGRVWRLDEVAAQIVGEQ